LKSWVTQSIGSSHFSPGGHAGEAQSVLTLTWQLQPFTQSESLLQVLLRAWAGRATKPSNATASSDEMVK
jgi:hypothetical protein